MDENSWSPWETLDATGVGTQAGYPKPLSNRPIFDHMGRHIATPDLLDLESGTYGEYDGSLHLAGHSEGA